jgi:hypothetical protein
MEAWAMKANDGQNGKQGESKELNDAVFSQQAADKVAAAA